VKRKAKARKQRTKVFFQPAVKDTSELTMWARIRILGPDIAEYGRAFDNGYKTPCYVYADWKCSHRTINPKNYEKAMRAYDKSLGFPPAVFLGYF
jgi:hypothetical protein